MERSDLYMAETAAPTIMNGAGNLQPESDSALFHRRIEFHLARKHFNGFGNESSNGFKLVTLNPTSGPLKASGLGKKTEKSSEHSEAGLDPELSFEITFRRIVSLEIFYSCLNLLNYGYFFFNVNWF